MPPAGRGLIDDPLLGFALRVTSRWPPFRFLRNEPLHPQMNNAAPDHTDAAFSYFPFRREVGEAFSSDIRAVGRSPKTAATSYSRRGDRFSSDR